MKLKEITTASPIDKLVGRLDNAKHSGNGQWRAKCPVHQGEESKVELYQSKKRRLALY